MSRVTVVIPNYNGEKYIKRCLTALTKQSFKDFDVIIVDNDSEDESMKLVDKYSSQLHITKIYLDNNYGFSRAVNEGIKASTSEYVILLNNDAYAAMRFIENLYIAISADESVFAAQALMLQEANHNLIDSAGDVFLPMGWAWSPKRDKVYRGHMKDREIFSACAGAAIYRKSVFEEIGYFDEAFFAYLEDMDISYRARLAGYKCVLASESKVLHVGSGASGSRHNSFKVGLAARNSMLVMYKNMPLWQIMFNLPVIFMGFVIKAAYFAGKGLVREYVHGIMGSLTKMMSVKKTAASTDDYSRLQKQIWANLFKIF